MFTSISSSKTGLPQIFTISTVWCQVSVLSQNNDAFRAKRFHMMRNDPELVFCQNKSLRQLWGWRFPPFVGCLVIYCVLLICFTSLRFHYDVTHAYFIPYNNCSINLRLYGKYGQSTAAQLSNIALCHIRTGQTISFFFTLASGNMGYRT